MPALYQSPHKDKLSTVYLGSFVGPAPTSLKTSSGTESLRDLLQVGCELQQKEFGLSRTPSKLVKGRQCPYRCSGLGHPPSCRGRFHPEENLLQQLHLPRFVHVEDSKGRS